MKRALLVLRVVGELIAATIFGIILYAVSPLLFLIWLCMGAAVWALLGIVYAVRLAIRMEAKP